MFLRNCCFLTYIICSTWNCISYYNLNTYFVLSSFSKDLIPNIWQLVDDKEIMDGLNEFEPSWPNISYAISWKLLAFYLVVIVNCHFTSHAKTSMCATIEACSIISMYMWSWRHDRVWCWPQWHDSQCSCHHSGYYCDIFHKGIP